MTVKQLREKAKELGIVGRWSMTKTQLEEAIRDCLKEGPGSQAKSTTQKYIDNAPKGTVIAFKIELSGRERTLSGKIEEVSKDSVKVVTKNGSAYTIPRDKVIWVKTGLRWPKGVFNELKGVENGK